MSRHSSIVCVIVLIWIVVAHARSERTAHILQPEGLPVRLESATFVDDGKIFAWVWRNSFREAVYPRLRVFVFDGQRLVGGLRHCGAAPLQPGTRSRHALALDITGVTARHQFVGVVDEVVSASSRWRLRESMARVTEIARGLTNFGSRESHLGADAEAAARESCGCECEDAESLGIDACGGDGLAAFTCTPIFPDGCSVSYTCK
jgi:hypothetical protein